MRSSSCGVARHVDDAIPHGDIHVLKVHDVQHAVLEQRVVDVGSDIGVGRQSGTLNSSPDR